MMFELPALRAAGLVAAILGLTTFTCPSHAQLGDDAIRVVARDTFFPAKGRVCVRGQSFYVSGDGLEKLRYRFEQSASDKMNNMQISRSTDSGRSWSDPEVWWTVKRTPEGIARRGFKAGWADPQTGNLLVMYGSGVWPNDKVLERFGRGQMSYIVSRDGWRTELVNEPVKLTNVEQRDDGLFIDSREESAPLFSMMFGDRVGRPIQTSTGEILQPVQLALFEADGRRYNPGGGYTFTAAAVLIGKWRADHHIDWSISKRIRLGPDRSTRGAIEPTIAALSDGRILMVLRGSNDSRGRLPGYKWHTVSTDGGRTWNDVQPWTYTDGETFFSPSSCSQLVPHSSGKLYWIGNIVPDNPQGNLPRRPLVIGQVDRKSGMLMRSTVVTIDDLQEGEHPRMMLSNFMAYEDRESGEILLHMSRPFAQGAGNWTSPAYLYGIAVGR